MARSSTARGSRKGKARAGAIACPHPIAIENGALVLEAAVSGLFDATTVLLSGPGDPDLALAAWTAVAGQRPLEGPVRLTVQALQAAGVFAKESRTINNRLAAMRWETLTPHDAAYMVVHSLFLRMYEWLAILPAAIEIILRSATWTEAFDSFARDMRRRRGDIPSEISQQISAVVVDFVAAIESRFPSDRLGVETRAVLRRCRRDYARVAGRAARSET